MVKGIGPILLLGGAAAIWALSKKKPDNGNGLAGGEVVASGTRYNQLNMNGEYRVVTAALQKGFAFGPGNIGYIPEVKEPRGNWVIVRERYLDEPLASIEDAEARGIWELEERGYTKDAPG